MQTTIVYVARSDAVPSALRCCYEFTLGNTMEQYLSVRYAERYRPIVVFSLR
jgi:hypothetical protein